MTGADLSRCEVVELDPVADRRWDEFVNAQPHALVYHLSVWAQVLEATYRFKRRYIALEDLSGRLRAVMPLLYKRGPISGRRLRSLPVVPMAGPVGEDPRLELALMAAACNRVGAREQLVVTTSTPRLDQVPRVVQRPGLPRWVVPLQDGAIWHRGSGNPARGIRQSRRAGVRVRETSSLPDLRSFYRLYLRAQRRLGGLPRRFRQLERAHALLSEPGIFRLFLAEYRGRPVAGAVWHAFGKTVEGLYYGGDERYLHTRPNHALFAHVLDWALADGRESLDLGGAAPGSSLAYFKSQWGALPVPLYFYVYPADAAPADPNAPPAPAPAEIQDSKLLARAWKRCPLTLTRLAGAAAYRYL